MTIKSHPASVNFMFCLAAIFIVAVGLNYVWEIMQVPLFSSMNGSENIWRHCFIASLGDGVIVWIIHVTGWIIFRRFDWFIAPGLAGYGVMLAAGLTIAVVVEWGAVHLLQRWTYASTMPLVPGMEIGLVPILQMLILPPVIFYIVAAFVKRKRPTIPS